MKNLLTKIRIGWILACVAAYVVVPASWGQAARAVDAEPWYRVVEAEAMTLQGDWQVIKGQEGYFPSAPNNWSADRLRGGATADSAEAHADVEIPSDGQYAVWVRFESPYAFDVHFDVSISQPSASRPVFEQRFGDRAHLKCFNGVWRVQGPWSYHNTDYVYQKGMATLKKGPARITLAKSTSGPYTAARIVDLIFLTDDPALEPGREMNAWRERGRNPEAYYQPAIMSRCRRPVYFRLQVKPGAENVRATMTYRHGNGWRGPRRTLTFTRENRLFERYEYEYSYLEGQVSRQRAEFPENEWLEGGYDSGWCRYDLNTFNTASILAQCGADATFAVSYDPRGQAAETFDLQADVPLALRVAVGDSRLEDELFEERIATTAEEIAGRFSRRLADWKVIGKRPFHFGLLVPAPASYGENRWEFLESIGASGLYFSVPPELYTREGAERWGIDRSMGYRALQNLGLRFEYYEGNYPKLRAALERVKAQLDADGVGDVPQTFKMIEESGPPSLTALRNSEIIAGKFRQYLKSRQFAPADFLTREQATMALRDSTVDEDALWERVNLCSGTPSDAEENPALFYHSKYFGSLLFADNCAEAARMVEEIFPPGSRANSGAIFPQDGHGVRRNWYDEFMLFRRKGMTSFGSETTWGLNGTPYYTGVQSQSYEGAIARGVAKYHDATLGPSHLLACKRYGYPADFVELTTYALASHGYQAVHYYVNADFTGMEHYRAMKKAGHALGAIEDRLVGARVVPGRVALGWSETTAIWDQAVPTASGYNRPGNLMYALERHYLYLLLRHLQLSVDLVCEDDIAAGRLEDYDLFFMVGDHIHSDAAASLRQWVEQGGVLVASAGGGLWDEYNRPLDTLKEVYGIKGARQYAEEQGRAYIPGETYEVNVNDNRLEKMQQALRAKLELVHAHPADYIELPEARLPVLGYRQTLTVEQGREIATFAGGRSAIVTNSFGRGRAMILGFLPGISYHYQAYPLRPYGRGGEDLSGYLYPDYKPLVRDAMASLLRGVWPEMGATVRASHPRVEANLMRAADGSYHVALVNFTGKPLADLTIEVVKAEAGNPRSASATFAAARIEDAGEMLRIALPLDKFDFIDLK